MSDEPLQPPLVKAEPATPIDPPATEPTSAPATHSTSVALDVKSDGTSTGQADIAHNRTTIVQSELAAPAPEPVPTDALGGPIPPVAANVSTELNGTEDAAAQLAELKLEESQSAPFAEPLPSQQTNEATQSTATLLTMVDSPAHPASTSASEPTLTESQPDLPATTPPSDPSSQIQDTQPLLPPTTQPPPITQPTSSTPPHPSTQPDTSYRLKPILHVDPLTRTPRRLKIITQNKNGPCPLLSLCNVLLLRGEFTLPYEFETVSYERLLMCLGELLLKKTPGRASQTALGADGAEVPTPLSPTPDFAHNLTDTLNLIPTLQHGLDVNVRFSDPFAFELTPSLLVFDLFDIRLCHGWCVDPQDEETYRVVVRQGGSYNRVVEMVVEGEDVGVRKRGREEGKGKGREEEGVDAEREKEEEKVHDGLVAQQFLTVTAGQVTHHGLATLNETLPSSEFSVLFRNNHFSTLYKHPDGRLFTLVTDQGFVEADGVVWETLRGVDGDEEFVGGGFERYVDRTPPPSAPAPKPGGIAEPAGGTGVVSWNDYAEFNDSTPAAGGGGVDHDLALAISLQEEEN
ncbi:Ubiquitin carboxyl-terminal hydrolase MINDY-1, partial [Rhizophlyctis rosea]